MFIITSQIHILQDMMQNVDNVSTSSMPLILLKLQTKCEMLPCQENVQCQRNLQTIFIGTWSNTLQNSSAWVLSISSSW